MNLNQKFSILFWLNKKKVNKQSMIPLWVRITIDSDRAEFSTGKQLKLQHWDAQELEVKKSCPDNKSLNEYLTLMRTEITRHYNILLSTKIDVRAEDVRNSYKGIKDDRITLTELLDEFETHLDERMEINDLSEGRRKRFDVLRNKIDAFVKHKFKSRSIYPEDIQLTFIVDFTHYVRTFQKVGHNSTMKYAKDLKQIFSYAVVKGHIRINPFELFISTYRKPKREKLDDEELYALYNKEFVIKRLDEVRDCYVFSCYTGYAYSDAVALEPGDIKIAKDGQKWIIRDRVKTGTTENVPLLPIALEIINKYKNHPYCKANNKLLPINSNQRYNAYLKEVADLCGINKNLTTHTARHTFATTVCLANDVPMETVMEMLGHTDIRTTQIYGKIVQKKVARDMAKLKQKLSQNEID